MSWTNSKVFRQMLADKLANTTAMSLTSDTIKGALFNDSITPDNDVSAANSAYDVGQWVKTTNEMYQAVQWPQGGQALTTKVLDVGTADAMMFDADDLSSGSDCTLSTVYGVLVYDSSVATPVASQGVCYNYLGGSNSVSSGTFTVRWSTNGIFRITL
jgi:hypothetical protein